MLDGKILKSLRDCTLSSGLLANIATEVSRGALFIVSQLYALIIISRAACSTDKGVREGEGGGVEMHEGKGSMVVERFFLRRESREITSTAAFFTRR